jgi:hypothetical protein
MKYAREIKMHEEEIKKNAKGHQFSLRRNLFNFGEPLESSHGLAIGME